MSVRLIKSQPRRQLILDGDGMGEIRVQVRLTNAFDQESFRAGKLSAEDIRFVDVEAVVDTGAVRSVVPLFVLEKFGVQTRGKELAEYADGRQEIVDVTGGILFEILDRKTYDEALVLGDEVLIGQTVLEKLDLLADCRNRRLVPNPDHPHQPVTKII